MLTGFHHIKSIDLKIILFYSVYVMVGRNRYLRKQNVNTILEGLTFQDTIITLTKF